MAKSLDMVPYTEFMNIVAARFEPGSEFSAAKQGILGHVSFFCPVLKCLMLVLDSRFTHAAAIFMNSVYVTFKFAISDFRNEGKICLQKTVIEI